MWALVNSYGLGPGDIEGIVAMANSFVDSGEDLYKFRDMLNGMVRPSGAYNDGVAPVGVWHVFRLGGNSNALLSPSVWILLECAADKKRGTLVAIYC